VQPRHLLVEVLGQHVHLLAVLPPRVNSSICASTWFVKELLITNDGWPVPQPRFTSRPFGQHDDALAVGEDDVVDLRLDVLPLVLAQRGDVDLAVEVADVADDGVVASSPSCARADDAQVAGGGDEDVGLAAARPW
jgi:hypothetical protein